MHGKLLVPSAFGGLEQCTLPNFGAYYTEQDAAIYTTAWYSPDIPTRTPLSMVHVKIWKPIGTDCKSFIDPPIVESLLIRKLIIHMRQPLLAPEPGIGQGS